MFVGAADVGGQEGHHGGKAGTSVGCKSCEATDQGLVGVTTRDKELVVLFDGQRCDRIDGTTRPVGSCEWVGVDGLEAVALHNTLSLGFLGEETQEGNVLVGRPLKVGTKEPVDGAQKIDLELGRE